jgi:hypothetical protein
MGLYQDTQIRKTQTKGLSPHDWFIKRLKIFTEFTLPSMIAQTNRNFMWFVVIDKQTPPLHKKLLENTLKDVEQAIIVDSSLPFLDSFIPDTAKICIISFLDSDDMYSSNFVSSVQHFASTFHCTEEYIIDNNALVRLSCDKKRYQILHGSLRRTLSNVHVNSCFALVRPVWKRMNWTPWYISHTKIDTMVKHIATSDSMVCQVVHDLNITVKMQDSGNFFSTPVLPVTPDIQRRLISMFGI